ncbi:SipW-dependent-type signal peptide-containing protein [Candidatus Parcubacteria bacterium]|nr:SipW-dependent-type signal peptide-containing protein [Candidatus Parcubacteria bacterium]
MSKNIIISLAIIGAVAAIAVTGTIAYFFDTETSSGNTFTAGTIDLTLNETAGAPINLTNMAPGDTASGSMVVTNVGSLVGWLGARSSYVEESPIGDTGAAIPNMNADEMAKMLLITAFTADGFDMLAAGKIPDVDADGRTTVYDIVNDTSAIAPPHAGGLWYSYDADMTSGESHTYSLTVQFDPIAGNDYQGDGIVWTFEFLLDQQL